MDSIPMLTALTTPTDPRATKVIFKGTVFSWAEKRPFTPSGRAISIKGGSETNEDETLIRCHECGQWRARLTGQHLRTDGLTRIEYTKAHGLNRTAPLMAPTLLRKMSATGIKRFERMTKRQKRELLHNRQMAAKIFIPGSRRASERSQRTDQFELANIKMTCRAQLDDYIPAETRRLGRTPTTRELAAGNEHRGPIYRETIEWAFDMTYPEVLRSMGLVPRPGGRQRISSPTELAILKLRAEGKTYREIAAQLTIGHSAITNYTRQAAQKASGTISHESSP